LGVANSNAANKVQRFNAAAMISHRIFSASAALLISAGCIPSTFAAQAFVIIDSRTGHVLQAQEPKQKRQVGSLTKIAAAAVVLDWAERKSGDLNQMVTILPEAFVGTGQNEIGFQPGDTISLRDLLYAALVQSDNIAAYVLANHVGSTLSSIVPAASNAKATPVAVFVNQMNALAKQLKMERTRFVNPHGIDDNVKSLPASTAEDMARLSRYAMNKASFRFYVSQKTRQINFQRGGRSVGYLLRNTNELLGKAGIDGVKTGRTARAGECLVLSANREPEVIKQGERATVYPRHIIVVLLGGVNRFVEGEQLVARGWQLYDQWAAAGRLVDPQKVL
jgi:D-alanyl-D-alanine carboxypeptidase (penicillin-binding protein 5/6)